MYYEYDMTKKNYITYSKYCSVCNLLVRNLQSYLLRILKSKLIKKHKWRNTTVKVIKLIHEVFRIFPVWLLSRCIQYDEV